MSTPLFKKLGLKDGQKVILLNFPENYFDLLVEVPEVEECEDGELADFVHWFGTELIDLRKDISTFCNRIHQNGMIWVSWPKKSSKIATDLNYNSVKGVVSKYGLVDVKVSAIDETWTATKYVIPLKDRK
ncbi:DUF3052 family protein [Jiulongibacter sediminis]|uniref:DUF3052 domain-containing protein n=1 Tax=Jiulongibacter sediminis TaxID=1605367 RepID=A0A0P7BWE6_9BACT|nr:DUF3052 family protein [Jiulongibacter sediminis]KPM48966.1 hypothetical protein AFM12_10505 [Jiulongibacter sediminis]TBX25492.1 hypothetical protein TK44_10510 [Jiulongibacter sediminis]